MMTEMVEDRPSETPPVTDLVAAVHAVLASSSEPLTLSKIRSLLPGALFVPRAWMN